MFGWRGASAASGGGRCASVSARSVRDHVVDERGARVPAGEPDHAPPDLLRHDQAERVVMGGNEVHQCRGVGVYQPLEGVVVVAGRQPHQPCAGPVQAVDHPRERGFLHDGRPAGQHLVAGEQVEGLLRAGGDHDLLGRGGDAIPLGEHLGDRGAQRGKPERVVAMRPGDRLELGPAEHRGRVRHGRGDLRRALALREREVGVDARRLQQVGEESIGPVRGGRRGPVRHDPGPRPLPAFRHPLVAQRLVGHGHRVPADRELGGQIAFGGQT